MNINRKIQLAAAAVIANGALALGLLSPSPASAGSCNPEVFCVSQTTCGAYAEYCAYYLPPGCQLTDSACLYPQHDSCGDLYPVLCNYQAG